MAKMGRPKVDNPRNHKVSVRFTKEEYEKLKLYAESHSMTLAETLIKGVENIISKS